MHWFASCQYDGTINSVIQGPRFLRVPPAFAVRKRSRPFRMLSFGKKNQKSHMLVATKDARMNCPGILDCGPLANSNSAMTKGYAPFISHGTVCLEGNEKVPIYILKDTGAAQSLILDTTLTFSQTSTGVSVLLQGVELGAINVPLHTVYLTQIWCQDVSQFKTLPSSERHTVNSGE